MLGLFFCLRISIIFRVRVIVTVRVSLSVLVRGFLRAGYGIVKDYW